MLLLLLQFLCENWWNDQSLHKRSHHFRGIKSLLTKTTSWLRLQTLFRDLLTPRLVKIGSLKVRYTLYQQSINYHFCDRLNFLEGCKISDLIWRMLITFLFLFHCLLIVHQLVRKYHDSDCNKELLVSLCLLSNIMITNKIIVLIKNKIIIITHHYFFESTR